jgi:hypothetical protein
MTRKSRREIERAVEDLSDERDTTTLTPRKEEIIDEMKEAIPPGPGGEWDLERAMELLEKLENAPEGT